MSPAEKWLTQIAAQVDAALAALADEHEADFTRAVRLIESDAAALGELVTRW